MMGKKDRGDAIVVVLCVMALLSVLLLTLLLSSGFVSRHAASEARKQQTKIYAQSFLDALLTQAEADGEWQTLLEEFSGKPEGATETYLADEQDGYQLSITLRAEMGQEQMGTVLSVCAVDNETGDSYTSEAFLDGDVVERRR